MVMALAIIAFQLIITAILIRNLIAFRALPDRSIPADGLTLRVSILIPARNEEGVIERVVRSATMQSYPHLEVIVLDDRSDDRTPEILTSLKSEFPEILWVHEGVERPAGWLGKPWACHQLSQQATGDILLFVDADTILESTLCERIVSEFMMNDSNGMVTVWPKQITISRLEKTIIPMIYYTLLGFLFSEYTRRDPRWMPKFMASRFRPMFAAACGQCIAISRGVYDAIGGHECVKSDVVEDVGLARAIRNLNMPVRMYHGVGSIACRMYSEDEQISNGFRKNFLAGFDNNVLIFLFSAVMHLLVFVLPYVMVLITVLSSQFFDSLVWVIAVFLPILQRILLARLMQWPIWTAFTHVFGVLWFQLLGITVITDKLLKRSVEWKGRKDTT
jgi:chlorobactene glucosyltransferase